MNGNTINWDMFLGDVSQQSVQYIQKCHVYTVVYY